MGPLVILVAIVVVALFVGLGCYLGRRKVAIWYAAVTGPPRTIQYPEDGGIIEFDKHKIEESGDSFFAGLGAGHLHCQTALSPHERCISKSVDLTIDVQSYSGSRKGLSKKNKAEDVFVSTPDKLEREKAVQPHNTNGWQKSLSQRWRGYVESHELAGGQFPGARVYPSTGSECEGPQPIEAGGRSKDRAVGTLRIVEERIEEETGWTNAKGFCQQPSRELYSGLEESSHVDLAPNSSQEYEAIRALAALRYPTAQHSSQSTVKSTSSEGPLSTEPSFKPKLSVTVACPAGDSPVTSQLVPTVEAGTVQSACTSGASSSSTPGRVTNPVPSPNPPSSSPGPPSSLGSPLPPLSTTSTWKTPSRNKPGCPYPEVNINYDFDWPAIHTPSPMVDPSASMFSPFVLAARKLSATLDSPLTNSIAPSPKSHGLPPLPTLNVGGASMGSPAGEQLDWATQWFRTTSRLKVFLQVVDEGNPTPQASSAVDPRLEASCCTMSTGGCHQGLNITNRTQPAIEVLKGDCRADMKVDRLTPADPVMRLWLVPCGLEVEATASSIPSTLLPSVPPHVGVDLSIRVPRDLLFPMNSFLGGGAYGRVHRAIYRGQLPVAVKFLTTNLDKTSMRAFMEEVHIMSSILHPNVVRCHGACTEPPYLCIVQELMEMSLADFLHKSRHDPALTRNHHLRHLQGPLEGPGGLDDIQNPHQGTWTPHSTPRGLPLLLVVDIALDIAAALGHLHPTVVHRDLKPQNILLDARGHAKVADFGIARMKEDTYLHTLRNDAGTIAYMAPECFTNEVGVGEKSDIFSLGVILWECVTGSKPWMDSPHPVAIIYQVVHCDRRPPWPEHLNVPEGLKQLVAACWRRDPHDRPSASDVIKMLNLVRKQLEMEQMQEIRDVQWASTITV